MSIVVVVVAVVVSAVAVVWASLAVATVVREVICSALELLTRLQSRLSCEILDTDSEDKRRRIDGTGLKGQTTTGLKGKTASSGQK